MGMIILFLPSSLFGNPEVYASRVTTVWPYLGHQYVNNEAEGSENIHYCTLLKIFHCISYSLGVVQHVTYLISIDHWMPPITKWFRICCRHFVSISAGQH